MLPRPGTCSYPPVARYLTGGGSSSTVVVVPSRLHPRTHPSFAVLFAAVRDAYYDLEHADSLEDFEQAAWAYHEAREQLRDALEGKS
jgi:hypothetical protein